MKRGQIWKEKAAGRHRGELDSGFAGPPPLRRLRFPVATCCQAADGHACSTWAERDRERKHLDCAQVDEAARVVRSYNAARSRQRAGECGPDTSDAHGNEDRLHPVGNHAVPTRLRRKAPSSRCWGRQFQRKRLASEGTGPREAADSRSAGQLGATEKASKLKAIQFAYLDDPQRDELTSGRSAAVREARHTGHPYPAIVPPRYERRAFLHGKRPAAGHLYREAICTTNWRTRQ